MPRSAIVVTTINPPTKSMLELASNCGDHSRLLIVIGDVSTPSDFVLADARTYFLSDQRRLKYKLPRDLPEKHYSRKNVGYLLAMAEKAPFIQETDDDNFMRDHFFSGCSEKMMSRSIGGAAFVNIYGYFSRQKIWPRGLPLTEIQSRGYAEESESLARCPVQQFLINGDPDVDAIYRLVLGDAVEFDDNASFRLSSGTFCPFNSQATSWWPLAYPLMYLPSGCSSRLTDIWRGFIAQRILWTLDCELAFHSPAGFQIRNPHDLMHDYEEEAIGYLKNKEICNLLRDLELAAGHESIARNLNTCYRALIDGGFLPIEELDLLGCWIDDLRQLGYVSAS